MDALAVGGSLVVAVSTPGIYVVSPEVNGCLISLVSGLASEIMRQVIASGYICSGISDAKGRAVALGRNVALGIADCSFDVGCGRGLVCSADVLVSGKEANDVLVLAQCIDNACVSLIQRDVPTGVVTLNRYTRLAFVGLVYDLATTRGSNDCLPRSAITYMSAEASCSIQSSWFLVGSIAYTRKTLVNICLRYGISRLQLSPSAKGSVYVEPSWVPFGL